MIFQTKCAQKVYFRSKTEQMNLTIKSKHQVSPWSDFFFFFFFWGVVVVVDQICSKRVFLVQFEHHPWIQHIRINLSTEFHLKKAIFCTNEHHHRLYHIWVSLGTMFHLKQTILSFGPTLTKTGISGPKQKKCISSSNSAYSN